MSEDDDMDARRGEKKTEVITIRVPEDMHADLMRLAAHEDRAVSDTTRRLIEVALYGHAHKVRRRSGDAQ